MNQKLKKEINNELGLIKYAWLFILVNVIRFLKFFPNNDPILGPLLAGSKGKEWIKSGFFMIALIVFFDFFTAGIGSWTYSVIIGYFAVIIMARTIFEFFKKVSMLKYAWMSILGVLLFDFVTGPFMIGIIGGYGFVVTFMSQIPFTVMHLFSGVFYTFLIVPMLDKNIDQRLNVLYWLKFGLDQLVRIKNIISFLIVLILLLFSGCSSQVAGDTNTIVEENIESESFTVNIEIDFSNETIRTTEIILTETINGFDLMDENFDLEYQMFGSEPFITSIDGVFADGTEYYWSLEVDGEYASFGIGSYDIDSDIIFTWIYKSVNDSPELE